MSSSNDQLLEGGEKGKDDVVEMEMQEARVDYKFLPDRAEKQPLSSSNDQLLEGGEKGKDDVVEIEMQEARVDFKK